MAVVLLVLISAPQASLLLTEEQKTQHTERGTRIHTQTQQASSHTCCPCLTSPGCCSSVTIHTGKHRCRSHYLLFCQSYGHLWHQNNNKFFFAAGLFTSHKHIYNPKPPFSVSALMFVFSSILSQQCFFRVSLVQTSAAQNNYRSDVPAHDKLSR